jgi:hypothetical protein
MTRSTGASVAYEAAMQSDGNDEYASEEDTDASDLVAAPDHASRCSSTKRKEANVPIEEVKKRSLAN